MDAHDGYFYPTANLADYDATLHAPSASAAAAAAASFSPLDHDLPIDLHSFAAFVAPTHMPDHAHPELTPPASDLPRHRFHPASANTYTASAGNTFDDAFSDVLSNHTYDSHFYPDLQQHEARTPPLDTDDGLLKLSPPSFKYTLLDYAYRTAPIQLDGQLSGMFFSDSPEPPTPGAEEPLHMVKSITCYRRNLFSVTGSISIPRSLRYISTEHGEQIPIVSTEATISAMESMEGAAVKLIAVPFKGSNAPPDISEKADTDPHTISIDLMGETGGDTSYLKLPLAWKRLQFRASTANNGRRKELQQHFIIRISLVASLSTGQRVCLADISTGPIVVRGRSPRNFANKKEAPTSGSIPSRKPTLTRFSSSGMMPPIKSEPEYNNEFGDVGMHADPWNYHRNSNHGAMTALPPDTFRVDQGEFFAQSSPDISRYTAPPVAPPPVNLSLTEEVSPPKRPSPSDSLREGSRSKVQRLSSLKRPPSFSLGGFSGLQGLDNDDAHDPLYEYFPLGLDDWQEPVDAVYRPHVVHHIALPSAAKDIMRGRSKRYFSDASPS